MNGGLEVFGSPITPQRIQSIEDRCTSLAQYFERRRMEYHEELAGKRYEVLLGLLGCALVPEPASRRVPDVWHCQAPAR